MSRGLMNNNPLNIRIGGDRWQGEIIPSQDRSFKQFSTMAWGYRAAFKLLNNYRKLHGCRVLADFIERWAPPSENDTHAYIDTVAKRARISDLTPVDTQNGDLMCRIVAAMSRVENGEEADMEQVRAGWELYRKNS